MEPVRPVVMIDGDRVDNIMGNSGWVVGYSRGFEFGHRVVWCFGFLPGTPAAKAYGVSVPQQTWVLAKEDGTTKMSVKASSKNDLPQAYLDVLNSGGLFGRPPAGKPRKRSVTKARVKVVKKPPKHIFKGPVKKK